MVHVGQNTASHKSLEPHTGWFTSLHQASPLALVQGEAAVCEDEAAVSEVLPASRYIETAGVTSCGQNPQVESHWPDFSHVGQNTVSQAPCSAPQKYSSSSLGTQLLVVVVVVVVAAAASAPGCSAVAELRLQKPQELSQAPGIWQLGQNKMSQSDWWLHGSRSHFLVTSAHHASPRWFTLKQSGAPATPSLNR